MKIIHVLESYENYLNPDCYVPVLCDAKLRWRADDLIYWNDQWVDKENAYTYCKDNNFQLCENCQKHPEFVLFILGNVGE